MTAKETKLSGCFIIEPQVFEDKRGYFVESFNQKTFNKALGLNIEFVQDNESQSSRGVLRGLHYQLGAYAQAKLVRVIKGKVLDIVVDLRPNSVTFGEHFSVELSEQNKTQLFVPRGFAHGFIVLKDETIFSYKCDNYYHKASEAGIIYNDEDLNIDWQLPSADFILSDKDIILPKLKEAKL
ncbi:dTDP-4-dehydrorhamnose 3,5-epimerase [Winogradskyella psychrotolerans]|uniref:dTDP-4-dehydrorhamnose 3,5-epimerase n=1 Tax=Winogradskyella psychrotolerans TaxID=1344585 RepID=UPI001C06AF71|nr:dTDP-4-dehydrorhamnose 3,5-epimerase [Winogradskyella psychrotolerans]MBU2926778.1 dTDP-4-dehydrorhamnose 3,5-epimerase [Winogradskyella psychrotolerans]